MIFDLFSTRNKPLPEVFSYDALPDKLRVQVAHILRQSLGEFFYLGQLADQIDGWRYISEAIAAAHGPHRRSAALDPITRRAFRSRMRGTPRFATRSKSSPRPPPPRANRSFPRFDASPPSVQRPAAAAIAEPNGPWDRGFSPRADSPTQVLARLVHGTFVTGLNPDVLYADM